MQGMGWTCLEELVWGDAEHKWLPPGVLHTRGPGGPPLAFYQSPQQCKRRSLPARVLIGLAWLPRLGRPCWPIKLLP